MLNGNNSIEKHKSLNHDYLISFDLDTVFILVSESLLVFIVDTCPDVDDTKHELHGCPIESDELMFNKFWCIGVDV